MPFNTTAVVGDPLTVVAGILRYPILQFIVLVFIAKGARYGVLLLAADILARGLIAPQEIPVGVLTAVLSSLLINMPTVLGGALSIDASSAIGVVYGDIGTSPIYAFRETFAGHHPIPPDHLHIFDRATGRSLLNKDA